MFVLLFEKFCRGIYLNYFNYVLVFGFVLFHGKKPKTTRLGFIGWLFSVDNL